MYKLSGLFLLLFLCYQSFSQRPNIVMIVSDDHAYQAISAYGSTLMNTPNIDRIATEGAIFQNAYVTNSICGPSRAVLLTGKYSHKNGFRDNLNPNFNGAQDIFSKRLQQAGYQTAWIGKWHLGSTPTGFDFFQIVPGQGSYFNPDFIQMDGSRKRIEGYLTNIVSDLSEQWLQTRDTSKPFCLVIGHKATHRTWMPDTVDLGRFDTVNFPLPDNFHDQYLNRPAAAMQDMTIDKTMLMEYDLKMFTDSTRDGNFTRMNARQRKAYADYYYPIREELNRNQLSGKALVEWKYQRYLRDYLATAASMDRNIGRILDYLDQHDLAQNTVVIYLSDQGFYLGEHGWFDKRFMYEESFRTPMVMRYPGKISPGTVISQPVLNLDIAPTILQIAGANIPDSVQGKSMLPLFNDKKTNWRDAVYYHYYEYGEHAVAPHFGVKKGKYKLIRFYKTNENWELYDLEKDPGEVTNLYGRKEFARITRDLKAELKKQVQFYEDADAEAILKAE